jgi:hypothetical protein
LDQLARLCGFRRHPRCGHYKKKALILFEILIALSLTAILLTFLFSFFVEAAKIEKKLDNARKEIAMRSHLQTRLQAILSTVSPEQRPSLYTQDFPKEKSTSLIAIFDNGIDPDPAFSGAIIGRVFLDAEQNLILATWPLNRDKNAPWRKEVLLAKVESFEFEFLGSKSAAEKKEKLKEVTANLAWRTLWGRGSENTPSLVRLTVKEEGQKEPLHFAFILPSVEPFVTYRERAS